MSQPAGSNSAPGNNAVPGRVTLNGQPPLAGVSPNDRGLQFGDGLFETLACRQGKARFLSLHLERLTLGCQRLSINLGDVTAVRREIEQVAAAAGEALMKLMVTRGDAVTRGYAFGGSEVATRLLYQYPLPPENEAFVREGIRARIARLRYGENELLAGMKHLNRLEQVLARSEVPVEEAAELLVFSSAGHLISGTMTNVFLVQNGRLRTPRLDRCGVEGVMRRVVLREARNAGIPAEQAVLTAADLDGATEIFVTNARVGAWPVRVLEDRVLNVGPVTRRIQGHLTPLLEQAVDA